MGNSSLVNGWVTTKIFMIEEEPNETLQTKGKSSTSLFKFNMGRVESFYMFEVKDEDEKMLGKTCIRFESDNSAVVDIWFKTFVEMHQEYLDVSGFGNSPKV